jgi:hypothetical protein
MGELEERIGVSLLNQRRKLARAGRADRHPELFSYDEQLRVAEADELMLTQLRRRACNGAGSCFRKRMMAKEP